MSSDKLDQIKEGFKLINNLNHSYKTIFGSFGLLLIYVLSSIGVLSPPGFVVYGAAVVFFSGIGWLLDKLISKID